MLCETVIMHLGRALIAPSVRRMLDIVKPGGIFYLSWRVTEGQTVATPTAVSTPRSMRSLVRAELAGMTMLLNEQVVSASSGKKIHRLVVRKTPSSS